MNSNHNTTIFIRIIILEKSVILYDAVFTIIAILEYVNLSKF